MHIAPIRKRSVVDDAISKIKKLIDQDYFRYGDKLPPERELAKQLGISLPSLREALRALGVLGVVEVRQGNGTYLRSSLDAWSHEPFTLLFNLHPAMHLELFEARIGLEGLIAELAAKKRSVDDLKSMEHSLQQMKAHLNDRYEWIKHDFEFHDAIVKASHNMLLQMIMERLYKLLHESREKTVKLLTDCQEAYEAHYRIYQGILAGDPWAAREAIENNLTKVEQRYRQTVSTVPSDRPR